MSTKLKEPIANGSLRATNFFNGRLVTGADLTREQTARRQAVWRVGRAAGDGIVNGLEVSKAEGDNPLVKITKGLAVNRCGQTLYLADDTTVDLLQRFGSIDAASTIFGDCEAISSGTYVAGFGLYLLVLSPVESNEGLAPTSGLNNALATCNTDVILETVQFNLYPIDPYLTDETLPVGNLLRNYLAYRCFGYQPEAKKFSKFFTDPLGVSIKSYGLLDEMRSQTLSDSDVPLAIINWTSAGLQFIETLAVRRRVTRRDDDEKWTQLVKDRRASQTEAMMAHFAEQIGQVETKEASRLPSVVATEYFRFLPPAGIMPVLSPGKPGFDPAVFFGANGSTVRVLPGDVLPVLLEAARSHEPIDLTKSNPIQLYSVEENTSSLGTESVRKALVFARHSLPYMGKPFTKTQMFSFAPNFLPLATFSRWFIDFNVATLLLVRGSAGEFNNTHFKGSMLVTLPENSVLQYLIVRGTQGVNKPNQTFNVRVERKQFDSPASPTALGGIELKTRATGAFKAQVGLAGVTINNQPYQYIVTAEWRTSGTINPSVSLPEIHSIQIVCAVPST